MPGADDNSQTPGAGGDDKNKGKEAANTQTPGAGDGGDSGGDDGIASIEDAKKIIKELRAENAKRRADGKSLEDNYKKQGEKLDKIMAKLGLEDKEADPEEQIQQLSARGESLEFELSIVQLAREHGIAPEDDDYFRFKLQKAFDSFAETAKDNEEMSDDKIMEVVNDVKRYSAAMKQKPNSTGVDGKKPPAGDGGGSTVTLEQFKKMSLGEKSELYQKDQAAYEKLSAAARA